MDEANGESGTGAGAETGEELPSRRVPGQRDPGARTELVRSEPEHAKALRPGPVHPGVERPETAPPRGAGAESGRVETSGAPTAPLPLIPAQADRPDPAEPPAPGEGPAPADDDVFAAGHPAPHESDRAGLSDTELLSQVRGGQDRAYEELYRRHAAAVRRYARGCCRDAHTAEDLTGEVFARTLQAIRGGSGPQTAVRAYLLTTVRRVAAAWGSTARREQLVEDFAVFAVSAADSAVGGGSSEPAADVHAMHRAEQSLAVRAFRTLPERWQTVLWHTAVEDESPSEIAPLLGLTPNATAVLAHRAREGLRQAYLQAHVSSTLTSESECGRYADRLGAHARGALRTRADRELNRHLKTCARCSAASLELADLNSALKGLLPVAFIGWFAAAYVGKAAVVVGGTAAAAGGSAAGWSAAGGAAAGTAATGGGTGAGAAGGAAAAEGLGAPVKAGIAAALVVAVAGTALAFVLTSGNSKPHRPEAARAPLPPAAAPAVPAPTRSPTSTPKPPQPVNAAPPSSRTPGLPAAPASPSGAPALPGSPAVPPPAPPAAPGGTPGTGTTLAPSAPASPTPPATSTAPAPPPPTTPPPTTPPPSSPPPESVVYRVNSLPAGRAGHDAAAPTIRIGGGSWWWNRWGLNIGGTRYAHGITVHGLSTVTIDLHRACVSFDAQAGVDDLTGRLGARLRFSVYGDGARLWSSPVVRGGGAAVPARVGLSGVRTLKLVVEPQGLGLAPAGLADWARAEITCG